MVPALRLGRDRFEHGLVGQGVTRRPEGEAEGMGDGFSRAAKPSPSSSKLPATCAEALLAWRRFPSPQRYGREDDECSVPTGSGALAPPERALSFRAAA
jgi:hypothetical protein